MGHRYFYTRQRGSFPRRIPFTHRYPKHLLTLRDASLYEQTPIVRKPEANQTSKPPRKKNQHLILDLHFDQLVNNPDHYDSFERLFIQKQKLEETLDFCKFNKIKKLEIIHGIGDGVLQKLVFDTLKGKTNIEFEESDFSIINRGRLWLISFRVCIFTL